jgi:hypothetical protein
LSAWLANTPDAICILCGQASGNVEIIDFDAGGELFSAWWQRIPADLRERLVVERTPSGGWHVVYRCQIRIRGNMKLAQRRDGTNVVTLIETRGEGGLFLCAPTPGYEVTQGDLCDLPVLTEAERDTLLQAAWELNEYMPPVVNGPPVSANVGQRSASSARHRPMSTENSNTGDCLPHNGVVGQRSGLSVAQHDCPSNNGHHSPTSADRPGDDFNHRGDVRAVLEQHGWVRLSNRRGRDGNEYWRRPGKDSGTSATLKDRVFYVFSSNAGPFEPNRAYSPFAVYTLLEPWRRFRTGGALPLGTRLRWRFSGDSAAGADISAIVRMSASSGACPSDNGDLGQTMAISGGQPAGAPEIADPGPIPEICFQVPGLHQRGDGPHAGNRSIPERR